MLVLILVVGTLQMLNTLRLLQNTGYYSGEVHAQENLAVTPSPIWNFDIPHINLSSFDFSNVPPMTNVFSDYISSIEFGRGKTNLPDYTPKTNYVFCSDDTGYDETIEFNGTTYDCYNSSKLIDTSSSSVVINSGASDTSSLTLNLTIAPPSEATHMMIGEHCFIESSWMPVSTSTTLTHSGSTMSGHYAAVIFKNANGNLSDCVVDSINYTP